ncbi:UdgX family uracil-DNA binding protein [Erythrobacter dokdonensis]|uniref:Type-4 uracil-DNA glycosylase n=1 Tax=Erythrobacter dokdonensis DSW-74 TaxID=1300349 RepID=A0A1A7BJC0_9SPHN|nr:UdgX family uracil-DNA binding protein [Erythrobacter dokdonensis]OBV11811.1 Uracil-DNA glycosylase:Phage SPO1 DNA polymerase-related protein [Erythrobacter dokdonensis DSW-74]
MTAMQNVSLGAHYAVHLPAPDDFAFWRERARGLLQCDVPPDRVSWIEPGGTGDLFASEGPSRSEKRLPAPPADAPPVRASKRFLDLARRAAQHSDPARFGLLYRVLWRLQRQPRLMEDKADPEVRRIEELAKAVRRDAHKMHAFVRFREVAEEDGTPHFIAWFEPDHHIVRAEAGFFMRRFANMRWSILTPRGSIHWDGEAMREGPPARRSDASAGDPVEDLWRSYYAAIFNPARLKVSAMLSEMPRKYWKNLPEAELIPQLIAGAQAREAAMVKAGAREERARPATLVEIAQGIAACRDCPIADCGTRAVAGEGATGAALMIVGEQPGDREDVAARPFVGPAGQLLDEHLQAAGIDRSAAYVTNAVKHFKFAWKGKHRVHQSPTAKEIDTCRWWLESERALVRPRLVLALGTSAARGLLGRTVSVTRERGRAIPLDDGTELWVTVHPSYLLRLDGAARDAQAALFAADLAAVRERLREV